MNQRLSPMFYYISHLTPGLLILGIILLFIGFVSQIALYAKAGKPGLSALVPIWNVIVFLEIVGRPKKHALWIIIPGTICLATFIVFFEKFDAIFPEWVKTEDYEGFGAWNFNMDDLLLPLAIIGVALIPMSIFIGKIFTEICDSFGKHKKSDKIYAIIFNAAYMLFNIAISQAVYEGPWYAKKHGIPYEMPDLKATGKKKKTSSPKSQSTKKKASASKSSGKKGKKEQSEVLAAIAEKYKKKK